MITTQNRSSLGAPLGILVAIAVMLTAGCGGGDPEPAAAAPEPAPAAPPVDPTAKVYDLVGDDGTPIPLKLTPAEFEFGDIPLGDKASGTLKVHNGGTKHIFLEVCSTNCGCTSTNCPKYSYILPNQTLEIEIELRADKGTGPLDKRMTLMFQDEQHVNVPIRGTAVEAGG